MAANKKSANKAEAINLEGDLLNCVSYATYYNRMSLFNSFRIYNGGEETLENLTVKVTGSTGLILPAEIPIDQLPAESSVELKAPPLLNPKYLADLTEAEDCVVTVSVTCGKTTVCSPEATVRAIPMDQWSGLSDNAEMLAAFVRPKLSDCQKVLAEAGLQLKTWGYSKEWSGYSGNDKNALMYAFASIFSAIRNLNIEREECGDYSAAVTVGNVADIVAERRATPLAMAVFAAACLEAAKFNPVLIVGKNDIAVGVWLYESCFNSALQDDMSVIERYVSSGVNNLAIIDAEDLFAHKHASFTTSAAHFMTELQGGRYDCCIDVKRCRIGGVFPMPIKVGKGGDYEILGDSQFSYEAKPASLIDADKLSFGGKVTKERNWQRRLLDLSVKNNLLNFRYSKDAVHLLITDIGDLISRLGEGGQLTILANQTKLANATYFGVTNEVRTLGELVRIELGSGIVRSYAGDFALQETVSSLIRKGRASQEEVGANTLFLALGFLKWKHSDEKEYKYAPIVLLPVTLKKSKTHGIIVEAGEDFTVNNTLIEFLYSEFGIDFRGIEEKNLSPSDIFAVFRSKTSNMQGWLVHEDAYISQFTFAGYAMWRDVKDNMKLYRQNPIILSLLTNTNKFADNKLCAPSEDEAPPDAVLTPLSCDSSQYSAVAEALKGTSFVLHGPPGTGKSQTITNIIANALYAGKTVLFVAEKQAAIKVVKKRLDEIGIGEFCMELHSGKTVDKGEIVRSVENTLSLKDEYDDAQFLNDCERISKFRDTLLQPLAALGKKRGLGVSVYEGIVNYLANASAPELVNIESTFYDNLTDKKLAEYEDMMLTAQAAAKECGGVYRSPFAHINMTDCDESAKRSALFSAEVVVAELKHLKNYLALFLDTFNQKISTFTRKKLESLVDIVRTLKDGDLSRFFACDERDFYIFFNANLSYDRDVRRWFTRFKSLVDVSRVADGLEEEMEQFGDDYLASRNLTILVKRLNRAARTPLRQGEEAEWIKLALDIEESRRNIFRYTDLAAQFTGITGGINDRKREDFLRPLYDFHKLCESVFMDYNADAFNSACARASDGHLTPLYSGILAAARSFGESCEFFASTVKLDRAASADLDIYDYYLSKCSALIDNIDMLPAWCMYKKTAERLDKSGLTFITDALENGQISGEKILSAFRKNVYRNFVQKNIPADPRLAGFSATVMDETASNFSLVLEEFMRLTRHRIRHELISRLPDEGAEGAIALELMSFRRQTKANLRSLNIRNLLAEIPELLKIVAPCMLMSPFTVSQYLPAVAGLYDIVVFDEASQMPTCEAVPSLARGKSAIVVGDPKQMPPTSFFMAVGSDEDNPEAEDLESVLDDCLALGMPEKHLTWHYRSKHESLIAFSNIMYYSSKLCTFPSPDSLDSKVTLRYIENGVYQRGGTKINKEEADALVADVIRRLSDRELRRSSIGIVTFSMPQQVYIERLLNKAISENGLDEVAYDREEPIFVKNLENVQGDERDVILFSVCYGPDNLGKITLNFGPLNQMGGWRRLNVAVSRAREEMMVFSSMRYSMIDLSRTTSRGVAGLKAFLEFAEKGRMGIATPRDEVIINRSGIGKYVARELSSYGYECRCDVGVSDFKIDIGVIDPKNKHNFILAVLCDGNSSFSIKDTYVMQVNTLKRNNWNVIRLYTINFFNNPKREIKKIKDYLDKLTSSGKDVSSSYRRVYRLARFEASQADAAAVLGGNMDAELIKAIKAVVTAEEPISEPFLIKRVLSLYGITKYGVRLENKILSLIPACAFRSVKMLGTTHYYRTDKAIAFDRYRVEEGTPVRTSEADYSPFDIIALARAILLENVSLYRDELINAICAHLKVGRTTDKLVARFSAAIDEGTERGLFIRSVSDRISLR